MNARILIFLILILFSLNLPVLRADDSQSGNWRTRSSALALNSYMESDTEEEVIFGREIAARLLGQVKMSTNANLQKYLNLVGLTLTQNSSRPDLNFHFVLIESSEVNAYATPGGYVFVTTALLDRIENEAELAGVLAHEISHVTERHIVKELKLKGVEKSTISSFAALIGGASESVKIAFAQAVDKAVDLILRDGYKKEDEMAADANAVLLCAFSGYDPSALTTLLDKVGKVKSGVGKTYPVYDLRLAIIQRVIANEGISGANLALNTQRFKTAIISGKGDPKSNIFRKIVPKENP